MERAEAIPSSDEGRPANEYGGRRGYSGWPVFRCPSLAGFDRPARDALARGCGRRLASPRRRDGSRPLARTQRFPIGSRRGLAEAICQLTQHGDLVRSLLHGVPKSKHQAMGARSVKRRGIRRLFAAPPSAATPIRRPRHAVCQKGHACRFRKTERLLGRTPRTFAAAHRVSECWSS